MKSVGGKWSLFLLVAFILGCAISVRAQSSSASLSGRVTDSTGAVIPHAAVTVTNNATGVANTATTNGVGRYTFPALKPGVYTLNVTASGFKRVTASGLVLTVQAVLAHDVVLPVGGTNQTVTVTDRGTDITTSSSVSTVIDRQFVGNIPLNGRTIQNLINLTPGVVVTQSSFGDGGQFSVNGQRADSNYFTVDGVSANIHSDVSANVRETGGTLPGFSANGTTSNLVSVDAIQEFRVQTSSFAPEYGRTPGAQVAITTRSGTEQFHGTAFEYFRNGALDASNWFDGFLDLPKAQERQNDFGGVVGGPIIPKRAFFFFSYEGQRLAQPSPVQGVVPDIASRSLVPAAVQPLLNAFPLPTPGIPQTPSFATQGIAEFNVNEANNSRLNATSLRLDDVITPTWSAFARYDYAPSILTSLGGEGATQATTESKTQTATVSTTKTFGPNIVNETIFNWSRVNANQFTALTNFHGATVPTQAQLFPPSEGLNFAPGQLTAFELSFENGVNLDDGTIGKNIQRQINVVDNFSDQIGAHQLKFGVDWRRLSPLTRPPSYFQIPVFAGILTPPPGFPPIYDAFTAASGTTLESIIVSADSVGLVFNNYSFYGQDTWQATPRTTITYGLRWDINPAPTGQNVKLVHFIDPYDVTNLTLAPAGTPLFPTKYGSVAPRVGISYRVRDTPNRATVVRGAFGVFYDLGSNIVGGVATQFPFFRIATDLFQPFPFSPAVAAPAPFSLNPPYGEVTTIDPKVQIPRTYEWNAAVEQGIGPSQSVTLTYVGALGRQLPRNVVLFPASAALGYTIQASGGSSNYNALQVQYRRQLYQRLQALASYTWSHSIDTQSVNGGFITNNINTERGSSDFDVRHALSLALTYQPLGSNFNSLTNYVTHGWSVDAIYVAQTATPVDLSATTFLNPSAPLDQRPDFVPGVPYFLHGSQFPGGKALNPAAFVAPPSYPNPGFQGNVPRNFFRGFNLSQLDVALHRQFPLYRNLGLQFRAEAFNVLNEVNYSGYDSGIFDPFFGQSRSTLNNSLGANSAGTGGLSSIYQIGGPRSLQLALKLIF